MDGHYGENHAVFGKMPAIPNHDVSDVAHSCPVDKNSADSNRIYFLRAVSRQLQHPAVLEDKAILWRHADVLSQPPMSYQMTVFAMNGNEVARPSQLKHCFKFFLTRMAGDVDLRNLLVMHLCPAAIQMINKIGNRLLVAGNKFGRENDRISRLDFNRLMVVQRYSVKYREQLPLASGRQESELVGRQVVPAFVLGQNVTGQFEISQFGSNLAVSDHAPSA